MAWNCSKYIKHFFRGMYYYFLKTEGFFINYSTHMVFCSWSTLSVSRTLEIVRPFAAFLFPTVDFGGRDSPRFLAPGVRLFQDFHTPGVLRGGTIFLAAPVRYTVYTSRSLWTDAKSAGRFTPGCGHTFLISHPVALLPTLPHMTSIRSVGFYYNFHIPISHACACGEPDPGGRRVAYRRFSKFRFKHDISW